MPKQRITEEMIVEAAFQIAKKEGLDAVIVKRIANQLQCSVQPIYSYCENMEGLHHKLIKRTGEYLMEYVKSQIDMSDYFRSVGIAHLHFARDESFLFKLYFLRKRSDFHHVCDIYDKECNPHMAKYLSESLEIPLEKAKALHLQMTLFSIGISTILATSNCDIPLDELIQQLDNAYHAFLAQAKKG